MCLQNPKRVNKELISNDKWFLGWKVHRRRGNELIGDIIGGKHRERREILREIDYRPSYFRKSNKYDEKNRGFHIFTKREYAEKWKDEFTGLVINKVLYRKPIRVGNNQITSTTITAEEMIIL